MAQGEENVDKILGDSKVTSGFHDQQFNSERKSINIIKLKRRINSGMRDLCNIDG